jgi:hypothetical protein
MKLVELGKPLDGLVPKVSREHIHLLWAIDYWDGPIQGVLEFDGEVLLLRNRTTIPRQDGIGGTG